MPRLERRASWPLPLTEVSALSLRAGSAGGDELVAVSDEQFDVLTVTLDDHGDVGECESHDVAAPLSGALEVESGDQPAGTPAGSRIPP